MGNVTAPAIIMITGAAGFIGRHTVADARARGILVNAVVRSATSLPKSWKNDDGIRIFIADMARPDSQEHLLSALQGVGAVVHLAAAMAGDRQTQKRDTLTATALLVNAITQLKPKTNIRLVLAGSIAVYDLDIKNMIDESSPTEKSPEKRDVYCQTKLEQEVLVAQNSAANDLMTINMRLGIVFGPGRLMNAFLGRGFGPVLFRFTANGPLPICYVENCAQALVLAATTNHPLKQTEVINVVDDDLPNRRQYITAMSAQGWPRLVLPLPVALLRALADVLALVPALQSKLPGIMRSKVLASQTARISYSNARLKAALGWQPEWSFEQAMSRSIDHQQEQLHG